MTFKWIHLNQSRYHNEINTDALFGVTGSPKLQIRIPIVQGVCTYHFQLSSPFSFRTGEEDEKRLLRL